MRFVNKTFSDENDHLLRVKFIIKYNKTLTRKNYTNRNFIDFCWHFHTMFNCKNKHENKQLDPMALILSITCIVKSVIYIKDIIG